MLITDYSTPIEKYKDYKNRTTTKYKDIIVNTFKRINECSLKLEDKQVLKKEILSIIENHNVK